MATGAPDDPTNDPSQDDWQAQLRQQILAGDDGRVYAGGSPTFNEAAPSAGQPSSTASPTYLAGDNVTKASLSAMGPTSDSGGTLNTTPGYTMPAPGPNASAPRPGVDASVVYTDPSGNAYDPPALAAAFANGSVTDPRVRDILAQYGYGGSATASAAGARTAAPSAGAYGLSNGYATMPGGNDPNQQWKDSIRKIIMSRLTADQGPVDENSPQIQAAINASKDAYTRQNTTERDALAERLYAQGGGLNTDAVGRQIQQSNERTGTAQSQLRANLLMSAYKDKFTELNHLLDLATSSGNTESAQQIQLTIANLQAALQREGLGVNLAEFGATLNQNAALAGLN